MILVATALLMVAIVFERVARPLRLALVATAAVLIAVVTLQSLLAVIAEVEAEIDQEQAAAPDELLGAVSSHYSADWTI